MAPPGRPFLYRSLKPLFRRLVRVRTFLFVFQHLASLRINADFLRHFTALDVERVAQAATALFFLKLFVGDSAGIRLQSNGTSFSNANFSLVGQFLTGVAIAGQASVSANPVAAQATP